MGENRALEAIELTLNDLLEIYQLSYRVYIKDTGWTDWVSSGKIAGTTGKALPIQAVEISITQNNL